ncbi:MAG: hypothetical protein Q4B70_19215 [Lachnospiraceae bacterium]|nr:hypothetical protein [Lachnospiraceae bacterium]
MIDLSKIDYRFVIMDESGKQYNIKDFVENLGWEQGDGELSTRISFTSKNEKSTKGLISSIAKLGCLVGIFATDGAKINEEVARGYIVDWKPTVSSDTDKLDGKCYDLLYNLQESQDNIYYSAGTGTKTAIVQIFDNWEIPLGEYKGPNESHGKLAYKSESLSDVILDILDDAYKMGGTKCVVQDRKGKVYVLPFANNKTVYHFAAENTKQISHKRSTAGMITRVKIIGQEDDDGRSSVEAVVNGNTKFGVRQKIITRGKDDSIEDAKSSGQEIIDDKGEIQEDITVQAPDIPFIRKGDLVHVTVGSVSGYYYVIGIRHDVDSRQMTLDLHVPYKEYEKKAKPAAKSYKVGDVVNFHGGTHYVSSYSGSRGYNARAGRAKITLDPNCRNNGGAHPWHLIHTDGGSNVYGWVDKGTFD